MNTAISVIVPVYNVEKYLSVCVESLLAQTFRDFELILVDDGSSDKSPMICDDYAAKDSRVIVVHKKNGGVSSARNEGIQRARGKFITFVDSDDYVDTDFLQCAYEAVNANDADMYVSGVMLETWKDDHIIDVISFNSKYDRLYSTKDLLEAWEVDYKQVCIAGPCNKLLKREIVAEHNILFDESMSRGEDTYFNYECLKHVKFVYFDSRMFYHYRRENMESLSNVYREDMYELYKKIYGKQRILMNEVGCTEFAVFDKVCMEMLIGCVRHYFWFRNKNSSKMRRDFVEKVSKDELLQTFEIKEIKGFKNRILALLLKRNYTGLAYLVLEVFYLRRYFDK